MQRTIALAAALLLTTVLAAQAQSTVLGGAGTINYTMGSSVSAVSNLMTNQGQATGGFDMSVRASSGSRLAGDYDPTAARDGCINYVGKAHNSADCSQIISWDPSWVLPTKPLNQLTGAEENMLRSYRILTGKSITNSDR